MAYQMNQGGVLDAAFAGEMFDERQEFQARQRRYAEDKQAWEDAEAQWKAYKAQLEAEHFANLNTVGAALTKDMKVTGVTRNPSGSVIQYENEPAPPADALFAFDPAQYDATSISVGKDGRPTNVQYGLKKPVGADDMEKLEAYVGPDRKQRVVLRNKRTGEITEQVLGEVAQRPVEDVTNKMAESWSYQLAAELAKPPIDQDIEKIQQLQMLLTQWRQLPPSPAGTPDPRRAFRADMPVGTVDTNKFSTADVLTGLGAPPPLGAGGSNQLPVVSNQLPVVSNQLPVNSGQSGMAGGRPVVGQVEGGYQYVGGDPAQPTSWRKVN